MSISQRGFVQRSEGRSNVAFAEDRKVLTWFRERKIRCHAILAMGRRDAGWRRGGGCRGLWRSTPIRNTRCGKAPRRCNRGPDRCGFDDRMEATVDLGRLPGCHDASAQGNVQFDEPFIARIVAPNLTYSIRHYSKAEVVTAIRTGVRPDGGRQWWWMPSQAFVPLTDSDLGRIPLDTWRVCRCEKVVVTVEINPRTAMYKAVFCAETGVAVCERGPRRLRRTFTKEYLEHSVPSDRDSMGKKLNGDGCRSRVRVVPGGRSNGKACQDVGLPMRLHFYPGHRVIKRQ
jgi:hypothetical protein